MESLYRELLLSGIGIAISHIPHNSIEECFYFHLYFYSDSRDHVRAEYLVHGSERIRYEWISLEQAVSEIITHGLFVEYFTKRSGWDDRPDWVDDIQAIEPGVA